MSQTKEKMMGEEDLWELLKDSTKKIYEERNKLRSQLLRIKAWTEAYTPENALFEIKRILEEEI